MKRSNIQEFNQIKLSGADETDKLFKKFKLTTFLNQTGIVKEKGHRIEKLIFIMLLIMLEDSRSLFQGMAKMFSTKYKTPVNDFLNNKNYNWRNFLYKIAKRSQDLFCARSNQENMLIFDDTSKKKTGFKIEYLSWFRDHCKNKYFKGFQMIVAAQFNGKSINPIDFELKIGKQATKNSKRKKYPKKSHLEQRVRFAKQKKTEIVLQMLKRAVQRKFDFRYILWDSWFNCNLILKYVFQVLKFKNIDLISMVKRGNKKYKFGDNFYTIKELYRKAGRWHRDSVSGIKHKPIFVWVLDVDSKMKTSERDILGQIKLCFYKYPDVKKFKVIMSTNLELSEMEVLEKYLCRWAIEVMFRDMKQYFGYDQNKASKYSAQIADFTIRCVFYIMFNYRKEKEPQSSMYQVLLKFKTDLFESLLDRYVKLCIIKRFKEILYYAKDLGYTQIDELIKDSDDVLELFFKCDVPIDKIQEIDNPKFSKVA